MISALSALLGLRSTSRSDSAENMFKLVSDNGRHFRERLKNIIGISASMPLSTGEQTVDEIQFEVIFINNDVKENFLKYLKQNYADEQLLFLLQVDEFKTCKPDEQVQKAISIWNQFIREGSEYEINIDGKSKANLTELISEQRRNSDTLTVSVSIFDKVYTEIYKALKDEFPRYLLSNIFREFAMSKNRFDILLPSLDYESSCFSIRHILEVTYLHDAILEFSSKRNEEKDILLWDLIQSYKKSTSEKTKNDVLKLLDHNYPQIESDSLALDLFDKVEVVICDKIQVLYGKWSETTEFERSIHLFIKNEF
jgi:hypothetical protein